MTPKGNQARLDSDITLSRERHTLSLQTAVGTLLRRVDFNAHPTDSLVVCPCKFRPSVG